MNRSPRGPWRSVIALVLFVSLIAAGCGRKRDESQSTTASPDTQSAPVAPDTGAKKPADTTATIVKSDSLPPVWVQIGNRQDELLAAIQNKQAADVHRIVTGTRDVVVALADSTAQASPALSAKLRRMVVQIKASTGRLDEFSRTGNLQGMEAEFKHLDTLLIALKRLTSG